MSYKQIQRECKIDDILIHVNSLSEDVRTFLSINNLPVSNNAVIYNLGSAEERWDLEGYLLDMDGVSADDEARKLKDKERKGDQISFTHPRYGLIKCYMQSYTFRQVKSGLGRIPISVKLIRDKEIQYPKIRAEKRQAITNARNKYQSMIDIDYTKSFRRITTSRQYEGLAGTLQQMAGIIDSYKLQINDAFGFDAFQTYKTLSLLDDDLINGDDLAKLLYRSIVDGGALGSGIKSVIGNIVPGSIQDTLQALLDIANSVNVNKHTGDYIRDNAILKAGEIFTDNRLEEIYETRGDAEEYIDNLSVALDNRRNEIADINMYRANEDLALAIRQKLLDELPSVDRLLEFDNSTGLPAVYWDYRVNKGIDTAGLTRRNNAVNPLFLDNRIDIIKRV